MTNSFFGLTSSVMNGSMNVRCPTTPCARASTGNPQSTSARPPNCFQSIQASLPPHRRGPRVQFDAVEGGEPARGESGGGSGRAWVASLAAAGTAAVVDAIPGTTEIAGRTARTIEDGACEGVSCPQAQRMPGPFAPWQ